MPKIKGYLDHLRGISAEKTEKTVADVVAELIKIGFQNAQDYLNEGNEVKDLSKIPRDQAAALSGVSNTTSKKEGTTIKFTTHSKVVALKELLDRWQGRPKQQVEIRAVILKRELTADEVKRLMEDEVLPKEETDLAIAT